MMKKYNLNRHAALMIAVGVVLVVQVVLNTRDRRDTDTESVSEAGTGSYAVAGIIGQTASPTLDALRATMQRAANFSGGNDDWEPFEFDFDGVTMVLVPAGCFHMGLDETDTSFLIDELDADVFLGSEQPAHEQCFDVPFWIDKYEVTNGQFRDFGGVAVRASRWTDESRPRESILWFEARDYCALRGARLPTEREWEYAARGPDNLIFPWGNEWTPANVVWSENSNGQTAEVGSRPEGQSWVGALDMSGNVFEWVSTIYGIGSDNDFRLSDTGESRYTYPYTEEDGREQDSEAETYYRVVRGSSWRSGFPHDFRTTIRVGFPPNLGYDDYGLRCARSLS